MKKTLAVVGVALLVGLLSLYFPLTAYDTPELIDKTERANIRWDIAQKQREAERAAEPHFKPWSVACKDGVVFVVVMGDGRINPYHIFETREQAEADMLWRKGGCQMPPLDAFANQVKQIKWEQCEGPK